MRKLVAIVATFAAIITASGASIPSQAALSASQTQELQARRAALLLQLDKLLQGQQGAASLLGAAEDQYLQAQNKVIAVRTRLNAINDLLASLEQQITAEQKRDADAQRELGILTRANYETAGDRSLIANLLSSGSFDDAMLRLKGADGVANQVSIIQAQLTQDRIDVARQRASLQQNFTQASALEKQLSDQSNQFMVAVATRDAALSSASGAVRAIEAQIADIDNQLAGNAPPVNGGAPCGNRFAFGQCTWYVATRRCIPWLGNANQWYGNAAAMGYKEGHTPAVGAVVVFWPGGDGASWVGHVAYVEQVGPADGIPAGYFKLSEMNFAGWDRVSYRVLPGNSSGIQGFIYGHA